MASITYIDCLIVSPGVCGTDTIQQYTLDVTTPDELNSLNNQLMADGITDGSAAALTFFAIGVAIGSVISAVKKGRL